MWLLRKLSAAIGIGTRAFFTLVGIAGITYAVADYSATQGAGTSFGSVIQTSVHYTKQVVCDFVAPATICATVKAANTVASTDVGLVVAVANTQAAVTPGDGITTTVYGTAPASPVIGVPLLWNGTTYDRASGSAAAGQRVSQNPYPLGAVPYTATATGTTAATTATLAGAASVTTYICGFSIRANATAAATGNATVTGVITATLNFTQWTAPLASGLGITEMIFSPCIPASGTNQSVAVVSAAPGAGGVVSVTAWGYKL